MADGRIQLRVALAEHHVDYIKYAGKLLQHAAVPRMLKDLRVNEELVRTVRMRKREPPARRA